MRTFVWFALGLALLSVPLALGCQSRSKEMGVALRSRTRFEAELSAYQRMEPQRALAVAGEKEGRFVTGNAFGRSSEEEAIEGALQMCELRRKDRQIQAACELHAIGDRIVAPSAGP